MLIIPSALTFFNFIGTLVGTWWETCTLSSWAFTQRNYRSEILFRPYHPPMIPGLILQPFRLLSCGAEGIVAQKVKACLYGRSFAAVRRLIAGIGEVARQRSLGHAEFVGIGAFTSTFLNITYGLTPWVGMFVGGIFAAMCACFLGYSAFRRGIKEPFFMLITIAAAQIVLLLALNIRALGGASGQAVLFKGHYPWLFQFGNKIYYYYVALGFLLIGLIISFLIQRSRLGRFLGLKGFRVHDRQAINVCGGGMMAHWSETIPGEIAG